jgi:type IV pilus assembly protein PilQ
MKKLGYLLGAAACCVLGACASGGGAGKAENPAGANPAVAQADGSAEASGIRLTNVSVTGGTEKTIVQLSARGPLSIYSSYNPEPSLLVVDIPNGEFDPGLADGIPADPRVRSVHVSRQTEFGRPFARLEIRMADGATSAVDRSGENLFVSVTGEAPAQVAEANPVPPVVPSEQTVVAENLPAASPEAPAAPEETPVTVAAATPAPVPAAPASARRGETARAAKTLARVVTGHDGTRTTLELVGDGALRVNDFKLENPSRLVLDLEGVTNGFGKKTIEVGQNGVGRIRVSQFQTSPTPIARVVLDLDSKVDYRIESGARGARVVFASAQAPAPEPTRTASVAVAPEPPAPAAEPEPEPAEPKVAEAAPVDPPAPVVVEPAPPEPPKVAAAPVPAAAPVQVAEKKVKKEEPKKSEAKSTVAEAALFEAAEAYLADSKNPEVSGGKFEPKNLPAPEQSYVGEPISLHLKENDIRDVLRTISNLTGLNIVIDPDVGGKVTIDLEEVPWDQALELILKVNGLSYQLDGNVMRIGATRKLQDEEKARRALLEEKELSQPRESYIMTLSYAKAEILMPTIKQMMSKRGEAIIDIRTNKIILNDIREYLQRAISLVEKLDIANQQVVIEARIVETTKNFSRSLGIQWGFLGQADASHGNPTNLQFPYDGSISGGVSLPTGSVGPGQGGPLLSMALGSILDTFNLDAALTAAESEGIAKIVSSPKVTTETNYQASIQSGVQIPVQTSANNTTTVNYIDATLNLTVTPQVTAQQTIIMDIQVAKREPLTGLVVAGGANVPLSTRQARTRLLVKDGGTAVIGGIYIITDNDAESRVPVLGEIPFIGALFRNRQKGKKHDELLIFITPRIVKS